METIEQYLVEIGRIKWRSTSGCALKCNLIHFLDNLLSEYEYDRDNGYADTSDKWLEEKCPDPTSLEEMLLNGARNWREYSWGGNALVNNGNLAAYYLTPSMQKRLGWKRAGDGKLYGGRAEWKSGGASVHLLDIQANSLSEACKHLKLFVYGKV